jgi:putative ABC transport system permease protein
VANNQDVNAVLPKEAAIALILISIVLTILAGFIPSKKAAKQDPVIALRSE